MVAVAGGPGPAGFRPHVTIQNKARRGGGATRPAELAASAPAAAVRGRGLHLWRYRDGPWETCSCFRFR